MTQKNRTSIEFWQDEDGAWKAREFDANHDLVGRGDSPAQAVAHYGELVHDAHFVTRTEASD